MPPYPKFLGEDPNQLTIDETKVDEEEESEEEVTDPSKDAYRKEYCERVERVVKRMPRLERYLIEERYMSNEHDYITDQHVYSFVFNPPISEGTYSKIRWKAFYKLALNMNLVVEVEVDTMEGRKV